ncbi:MAG: kinase [Acidobacteriota bacterium]
MIVVRTCARLHLGLLDNNGSLGRLYGSIGLAVNQPDLLLKAGKADALRVEGLDRKRVREYARRFIGKYNLPSGVFLKLENAIPAHVGLGSGTQLALAVGTALARLFRRRIGIQEIALAVGRGVHSGIGISIFRHGGFVLDGGRRIIAEDVEKEGIGAFERKLEKDRIPPVLFQRSIPKSWYFVLAIPRTEPGLSGEKEDDAFVKLPRAPSGLVEKISRTLLIQMLPALVEKDIVGFGRALTRIQFMVGDCFASIQGGRFANPVSGKMVDFMLSRGAAGIGQSSWGPTVYGLVAGKAKAQKLSSLSRSYLNTLGGGQVFVVQPQNRGARVSVVP